MTWHVGYLARILFGLVRPLSVCAALAAVEGTCQEETLFSQADLITKETSGAIDRGLAYLAEAQLEDGGFGLRGYSSNVATCGLAGMAFLASGSTPGRGPHGESINRCIDYLIACTDESGMIESRDATGQGAMYGHGFALLFLCETYGMAEQEPVRDCISRAVELTVRAQNEEGGWRYTSHPSQADVSVTVCQVMALRAARNAGIAVPRDTIERSIDYVKKCQNEDGGFRYMLSSGGPASAFPRSAAGIVSLYNAGVYEGDPIDRGLAYLNKFRPAEKQQPMGGYYFYGQYYAVQAMWHAGGEHWTNWYPAIRDELLLRQRTDGSWFSSICPEYGTAMACIVLQTPNNYLPILQR